MLLDETVSPSRAFKWLITRCVIRRYLKIFTKRSTTQCLISLKFTTESEYDNKRSRSRSQRSRSLRKNVVWSPNYCSSLEMGEESLNLMAMSEFWSEAQLAVCYACAVNTVFGRRAAFKLQCIRYCHAFPYFFTFLHQQTHKRRYKQYLLSLSMAGAQLKTPQNSWQRKQAVLFTVRRQADL